MALKKKKKPSSEGTSTREKMLARKKALEQKSNGSGFVFPKDGTTRVRIKSPGDDQELGMELITFYLGGDVKSVFSPATFGEPCPFMEKYMELKESKDPDDKELAKKFIPKRKYVIGGIVFSDDKGKTPDYNGKDKAILIPRSVYQDIIDLYLDEDEAGDMTDPVNGYDVKITRTGQGQFDTTYSARACRPTKLDPKLRGNVDLESMVREQIKSYDELEEILNSYLNEPSDEDYEEEEKPKKKSKDKVKDKKKKKKPADDEDLPF